MSFFERIIRLGKLMYIYVGLQLVIGLILFLVLRINPLKLEEMNYKIGLASMLANLVPVFFIVRKYKLTLISDLTCEFRSILKQFFLGLLLGFVFVVTVLFLQYFIGSSIKIHSSNNFHFFDLTVWLVLICVLAFSEEVFFRYVLFQFLGKGWKSMILSSFLFALMHAGNPSFTLIAATNVFLFGITTWLIYQRHKNLLLLIFLHASWNYTCGFLFGTNISGIKVSTSIFTTIIEGKEIITGSNFGIEGSIITSILLVIVSLVYLCSEQIKRQLHL